MTTSLFQPAFSIRWATSLGNLLTGSTSAQASPSSRTSRKSGDQPSSRAGLLPGDPLPVEVRRPAGLQMAAEGDAAILGDAAG